MHRGNHLSSDYRGIFAVAWALLGSYELPRISLPRTPVDRGTKQG
jgi:hypothetical protein